MQNSLLGIPVKKYISSETTSEVIVIKENIKFSSEEIPSYKKMFEHLKSEGILVDCKFDDSTWILARDYGYSTLRFDLESRPHFNTLLKCYILVKLHEQLLSPSTILTAIFTIRKVLINTCFLSSESLADFNEFINNQVITLKRDLYYVKEYISFSNSNDYMEYYEALDKISTPPSNIRLLPGYKSILVFDAILSDYIEKSSVEEREKYLPLLIWWRVTKVIPMRPIEFSLLTRDCCSYEKETDSYFIQIQRKKIRNGFIKYKQIPIINKINVTKDVYDLIQEYLTLVHPKHKSKQLISYKSYNSFHKGHFKRMSYLNKIDPNVMTTSQLRRLLNKFYDEVIMKVYNLTPINKEDVKDVLLEHQIERIQFGDTRHLAFCGMMLQGLNPLTIAQIGGHTTFREQMSYYQHLDTFIDAHTYILSKSIKGRIMNTRQTFDMYSNYKSHILEKSILKDDYYSLRKTTGGRCKSTKFPLECTELDGCLFCEHFLFDDTLSSEAIDIMSSKLNNEIKSKLQYIKSIVGNFNMNVDRGEYHLQDQEFFQTEFNMLNTLIKRNATVEAYKLILKE